MDKHVSRINRDMVADALLKSDLIFNEKGEFLFTNPKYLNELNLDEKTFRRFVYANFRLIVNYVSKVGLYGSLDCHNVNKVPLANLRHESFESMLVHHEKFFPDFGCAESFLESATDVLQSLLDPNYESWHEYKITVVDMRTYDIYDQGDYRANEWMKQHESGKKCTD